MLAHKVKLRAVLGLVALAAALSLWNLGNMEIQPYDEGYYALRVKAILQFDCWLDQTDYAIGGFYSASHPPLQLWLMAISAKLFGLSEFSLRLPSWCAFVGLLMTICSLAYRVSDRAALFAVIVVGFSPMLVWFARLGQFDMLVTLFSALQLLFYVRFLESSRLRDMAIGGIMLGLALLTKVLVGGFAAAAIALHSLYRWATKDITFRQFLTSNALFAGLGLGIGLSWFAGICAAHDGFLERYVDFYIANRVQENQTGATYRTGVFYYLNVLTARIPLSALSLTWIFMFFTTSNFRNSTRVLWLLSFALPFSILSIAQTKLLWYGLLCLPPMFLIIVESLEVALKNISKQATQLAWLAVGLALVWSATQAWHRGLLVSPEGWKVAVIIAASASTAAILYWMSKRSYFDVIFLTAVALGGAALSLNTVLNGLPFVQTYSGAKDLSGVVKSLAPKTIVHLVSEKRFAEKSFNPQFSYYFNGIDVDSAKWQSAVSYKYGAVTTALSELTGALTEKSRTVIVVEKTATLSEAGVELVNEFAATSTAMGLEKVCEHGNYVLYRQKE